MWAYKNFADTPIDTVSASPPASPGDAAVATLDYAGLVEAWGLVELADLQAVDAADGLLGEGADQLALDILERMGAPVTEGAEALQAWAKADPILLSTEAIPVMAESRRQSPEATQMRAWLQAAVAEDLSTGYNIVAEIDWPDFDPKRTVIYGHSDIQHARQLLALLRIEGLEPEFQFVPKSSAFRFREEWGGSTEGLLELADGGHLVVADEYDLFLTFPEPSQRARFAELVTTYAKKDEADEPGLIYGAWWQPFYRTSDPLGSMVEVRLIEVRYEGYRSNILSLTEAAEAKSAVLSERFLEMRFEVKPIWVNPSFYRYMGGGYR